MQFDETVTVDIVLGGPLRSRTKACMMAAVENPGGGKGYAKTQCKNVVGLLQKREEKADGAEVVNEWLAVPAHASLCTWGQEFRFLKPETQ